MKRNRVVERLTDADRERARGKIELSKILHRLGDTALGLESMKACELSAARILLDKALPNLTSIAVKSDQNSDSLHDMNTHDLLTLLAALQLDEHESSASATILAHDAQNTGNGLKASDTNGLRGVGSGFEENQRGGQHSQSSAGILQSSTDSEHISDVNQNDDHMEEIDKWAEITSDENNWHEEDRVEDMPSVGENKVNSPISSYVEKLAISEGKVKNIPTDGSKGAGNEEDELQVEQEEKSGKSGDCVAKRAGASKGKASGPKKAETAHDEPIHSGVEAPLDPADALIREVEAKVRQAKEEMNGTHSPASDTDDKGDAPLRKASYTKPVKGSIVPPASKHLAGKIR